MVKDAETRKKKFEAKVDSEVLKLQTTALKPLMVEGQAKYMPSVASLEVKVKSFLEQQGIGTLQIRDYLNFAREMLRLVSKFEGSTLNAEAQLKVNKWTDRGLNSSLLCSIANLLGVDPEPSPSPPLGEVDVTDRCSRLLGMLCSGGLPIDPRDIRALDANVDHVMCWGDSASLRQVESGDLGVELRIDSLSYDPRQIRLLTPLDIVTVDNLLNPHPVTQLTRTNLLTKPEREDLVSLGDVASPNNAGVLVVAGEGGKRIKVYDMAYECAVDGLHYFYFGTTTTPTSSRFGTCNTKGLVLKTFVQPRVGGDGESLYIFSSVSETNMPYDLGYVKE